MTVTLLKNEIDNYLDSSQELIKLATKAHACGYSTAARYFLKRSHQDFDTAARYSIELSQATDPKITSRQIVHVFLAYKEMEVQKLLRIRHLKKSFLNKGVPEINSFIEQLLFDQENELIILKNMLLKIHKIIPFNHIRHIDDLFIIE